MLNQALKHLRQAGQIGVIPTDTVYGLVAVATDRLAVERLYRLKNRQLKPGTIIAADIDQLVNLGLKKRYLMAVSQFWPGAVSVVIPTSDDKLTYLHQGLMSLAVRIPADESLRQLMIKTGPLLSSSANLPGQLPAQTIKKAKEYFGEQVDFYIDGGDLSNRSASTLIRMVDDVIEILRLGSVSQAELLKANRQLS